ncbi:MAG: prolyl oligopeptidase family serine peptidase [Acidobacteria bacterium]|nr:prolyl oligopeptidase family serine peptidase [Acidobacteriota bacterium]
MGIPTELVVYAGEGHMFVNPNNRVDMQDRTLAWFERRLK